LVIHLGYGHCELWWVEKSLTTYPLLLAVIDQTCQACTGIMSGTVTFTLWIPDLKLKWWLAMLDAEKSHSNLNSSYESSNKFGSPGLS
jgi:hypothetical protein